MAVSGKVAGSVGGVGVAGSITIIATWIVKLKWGLEIPDTVGDSITLLMTAAGAMVGGWIMPHNGASGDRPPIIQASTNIKENGQQNAAQVQGGNVSQATPEGR